MSKHQTTISPGLSNNGMHATTSTIERTPLWIIDVFVCVLLSDLKKKELKNKGSISREILSF